jgi:serine/threonine-protein kinase
MATVDLAEDTLLGRPVALKRMAGAVDVQGLSRLRREALAGASMSHTNVVSVYDIVTRDDGDLVIVMEYVEGETLRDLIAREGALPPSRALEILAAAAAGLDAIHGAGIVHRDVKPSNILLGKDGAVKVADLGVASVPDRTRITTAGSLIGSLSYMAPEQLEDAPVTPAIDIYALAAVAFEALSGVKARDETNPVALAHAITTKPPPSLGDVWPTAPPTVTDLLVRAMSADPRARPGSAGELVAGLKEGLGAGPPRPAARPSQVAAGPPQVAARPPQRTTRPPERPARPPERTTRAPQDTTRWRWRAWRQP